MSTVFSRTSPSSRYRELLTQYRLMHTDGERFQNIPPEQTFSGQSLPRHCLAIKKLVDQHGARSLLDYGSGKGHQYTNVKIKVNGLEYPSIPAFWGVQSIVCYDPGYEPFNRLPSAPCDGVICTDVLEHCPEDDLPWIVEELFSFARRFVFANVACYPAKKRLSNGENAHCTIRPGAWWNELIDRIAAKYPAVRYHFTLDEVVQRADGSGEIATASLQG